MKKNKPTISFKGPVPEGNVLRAKVQSTLLGPRIAFPHRHCAAVATGVEVFAPKGYRVRMGLSEALAGRGMVATNAGTPLGNGPVQVVLLNCGREIVEVKDGDPLVNIWLEAAPEFGWEQA